MHEGPSGVPARDRKTAPGLPAHASRSAWISWHRTRHSVQMAASLRSFPAGLLMVVARPVTWRQCLPQKLHRCRVSPSGTGCRGAERGLGGPPGVDDRLGCPGALLGDIYPGARRPASGSSVAAAPSHQVGGLPCAPPFWDCGVPPGLPGCPASAGRSCAADSPAAICWGGPEGSRDRNGKPCVLHGCPGSAGRVDGGEDGQHDR